MKPESLREVQLRGYVIEGVTEGACVARCPSAGCGVRFTVREGQALPARGGKSLDVDGLVVRSFTDLRDFLRDRREQLLLTIDEVEALSGVASTQLAKCERNEVTRPVNIESAAHWAAALGFELVLRPAPMPPLTLRTMANTRGKLVPRQQSVERQRAARA